MPITNRRNVDPLTLEPLWSKSTWAISTTSPAFFDTIQSLHPSKDTIPSSLPTSPSVYSFESFIEDNYCRDTYGSSTNIPLLLTETQPRSYFSPDTIDFDQRLWAEAEKASVYGAEPFTPGSTSSMGSTDSMSPSVSATATKVTFTPVRAIRRSIRQSLTSQLSVKFFSTPQGIESANKSSGRRPSAWERYTGGLRLWHTSGPAPVEDSVTEKAEAMIEKPPILPPLPFAEDAAYSESCSAATQLRKSQSTPMLAQKRSAAVRDSVIDMDGLHDATREATVIAADLSSRWKFIPVEAPKRRATVL